MSFVRPGQLRKNKTAFVKKRPHWDDSVSDLDAYRATPYEIMERRETHKSKNHLTVKLEKIRKEKQKQRTGLTNVEARQVAILKEVLHDQHQLDSVLTKTDHMLAMVKDLFGDDAKKFTGHPNVTLPPGVRNTSLPRAPEIHTRAEKLSESVMSQSALNDLSNSSEDGDEESDEDDGQRPEPTYFHHQLDLQRFQQFLQEEENHNNNAIPSSVANTQSDLRHLQKLQQVLLGHSLPFNLGIPDGNQTLSTISGNAGPGVITQSGYAAHPGPAHSTQIMTATSVEGQQTPPNSHRTSSSQATPPKSALNDTCKVKKSKKRVKPSELAPASTSSLNMSDMRQVMASLLEEIGDFERKTGRRSATDPQNNETFTGYTVSLVTAVTKLTHYMKETELRLQAEMMVREHLAQDVRQLTVTIDSLTQEIIMTQEGYAKLWTEFMNYKQQVQGEMTMLQAQMLELKQQQSHGSANDKEASARVENEDESFSALPDHVTQTSTAVLLSPVVRKTRVIEDNPQLLSKAQRQTSLVDIPNLIEDSSIPQRLTAAASNSSQSRGDPPRITQSLPVMGTVNVPRPIPLVQSNLTVPLAGSHSTGPLLSQTHPRMTFPSVSAGATAQHQSTTTTTGVTRGSNSTMSRDSSRLMETQIAELSRQHAEAQQRLQSLLVQQKKQHDHLQLLQEPDIGGGGGRTQQGKAPTNVSPPISPISHRSEHFTQQDPAQRLATMSREIRVSMPVIDLEVSAGSLNTSL